MWGVDGSARGLEASAEWLETTVERLEALKARYEERRHYWQTIEDWQASYRRWNLSTTRDPKWAEVPDDVEDALKPHSPVKKESRVVMMTEAEQLARHALGVDGRRGRRISISAEDLSDEPTIGRHPKSGKRVGLTAAQKDTLPRRAALYDVYDEIQDICGLYPHYNTDAGHAAPEYKVAQKQKWLADYITESDIGLKILNNFARRRAEELRNTN